MLQSGHVRSGHGSCGQKNGPIRRACCMVAARDGGLSSGAQLKLEDNSISERRFSDVFAHVLTRMTLSQFRVVQSSSHSEAIARLGRSTLAYFPFVGPIWPCPGTRLQILGIDPPLALETPLCRTSDNCKESKLFRASSDWIVIWVIGRPVRKESFENAICVDESRRGNSVMRELT
jgi:hypothetical protein